jgi:predicted TPR repeat methyltransferase
VTGADETGAADRARTRWERERPRDGEAYEARFRQLAASGMAMHGEVDHLMALRPRAVLDAGCGTGRVAVELRRRGVEAVGVDIDESMLAVARRKDPGGTWVLADLATLELGRRFDVVVAAGNVMIFLAPGSEAATVARLAAHLEPGGHLVAGFQLQAGRLDLGAYDAACAAAGLVPAGRWATWDREPFAGGDYAVSAHARPATTSSTGATIPV